MSDEIRELTTWQYIIARYCEPMVEPPRPLFEHLTAEQLRDHERLMDRPERERAWRVVWERGMGETTGEVLERLGENASWWYRQLRKRPDLRAAYERVRWGRGPRLPGM